MVTNKENLLGEKEQSMEKQLDSEATGQEQTKVYTFEILHMIKEAQQQHGLRHGDYQRYRGYCSRRIRRLRKALKFSQGDKRHFKKKDVTLQQIDGKGSDEKFIHIPLISAERAWAYAMQLRQEASTEPRKKFHLVSRLKRACFYSLQLQELCNSDAFDARSKLEAEAYNSWIHGSLHFELSLWKSAAEYLKKSQVIYENLAQALPEEEQAIYRAKVDEITPSLRYCSYNIGGDTSVDDILEMKAKGLLDNIDVLVNQTKTESSESSQTVEWRDRKVTVRPEKVRLFLLSVQELNKRLEKALTLEAKIDLIENILMDCKDAITSVKEEIKQDPKLRSSSGPVTGIQYLLAYLSHIRLIRTVERNINLVEQAKINFDDPNHQNSSTTKGSAAKRVRPQDLTRLYEIILQNIAEMQQINGMEEDSSFQTECEVLATAFKAFRCYYIALTLIEMKKWKEAVALYERSINYANNALKSNPNQFNLVPDLQKLIVTIEGCKFSAHAYSVLEHGDDSAEDSIFYSKSQKSSKPLFERLSQYKEDQTLNTTKNPNVFKLTPEMEPIPCKPLFFDLALNYVEFPDSLNSKAQSPGKKGAGDQAGISGFVKGFLGWGGKQ